jgi:hypothetical protein
MTHHWHYPTFDININEAPVLCYPGATSGS